MREVIVTAARRTAVGKGLKGTLRYTRPDDLGAAVVKNLLETHPNLDPARIGDVIIGCAMPEGEQGMNVARCIALLAGFPTFLGAPMAFNTEDLKAGNVDVALVGICITDQVIPGRSSPCTSMRITIPICMGLDASFTTGPS